MLLNFDDTLKYDIDDCPECHHAHKKGERIAWNIPFLPAVKRVLPTYTACVKGRTGVIEYRTGGRMNKAEIVAALEGLKDLTNESGKTAIHAIQRAVETLRDVEVAVSPAVFVATEVDRVAPVVPAAEPVVVDKRSAERDETSDQKFAVKLGLTK